MPPTPECPIVWYPIGVASPIAPDEPLPDPPEIPRGSLVVVEGREIGRAHV